MASLSDLRRLLGGYDAGAWFYADDNWSHKSGRRSFMLPWPWDETPGVSGCPRTTTPRGQRRELRHDPHPSAHMDRCRVDRPGWIVRTCVPFVPDELKDYRCQEPDELVVGAVQSYLEGGS